MRSNRLLVFGLVLLIALSVALYTVPSFASEDNQDTERRFKIVRFRGQILDVSDVGIEVESSVYNGTIFAKGKWLYLSEDLGERSWKDAIEMIELGDAKILMAIVKKGDKRIHVLLGIKQEGLILVRGSFTMRSITEEVRVKGYLSLTGTVMKTGEDYLVLQVRGQNIVFRIAQNLTWTVAGDGEVNWGEIKSEFTKGDTVQVYFHEIIRFNDLFAEFTGIRAIAGGYGTFIDLTDGVTITI